MTELVSMRELRAALMRWTLVLVPGILLLGYLSETASGIAGNEAQASAWLASLEKPAIFPSIGDIALLWDGCYILMGLALAVVIEGKGARHRSAAIASFIVLLAASLVWAPIFFGMHQIGWAFSLLCLLTVLAGATIALFRYVRPAAALLLLPCLMWMAFLGVLNWQILTLNPGIEDGFRGAPAVRLQIGS